MDTSWKKEEAQILPRLFLIFLAVDWPLFMRRPMIIALAEAARRYNTTIVAVNRPLCPISTAIKKPHRIRELAGEPRLEKLADKLYLFSPRYFIHDFVANRAGFLERINLWALRKAYKYLSEKLGIDEPNPLIWYYYPQQGYVTKLFADSFCIYEIYDNLTDIKGREIPSMVCLEKKYRDSVSLNLVTSTDIFRRYGKNYKDSIILGNGISRKIYDDLTGEYIAPDPEIAKISSPRIGYAGMVSGRLDWDLISDIAGKRPEWNFIFAGKIADRSMTGPIGNKANIFFTGEFERSRTPSILRTFDIGILPYRDNEFFRFLNPLKFYEYAAAGLGVVSSPIDQLDNFPNNLIKIIPNDADNWIEAIENQLKADRTKLKKIGAEIASKFIWEDMCADLLEKIAQRMRLRA
jgi:hypothetical protein